MELVEDGLLEPKPQRRRPSLWIATHRASAARAKTTMASVVIVRIDRQRQCSNQSSS